MLGAMAGGMSRRGGLPISERVKRRALDSEACPVRHCWVAVGADGGSRRPGLLVEWRRAPDSARWQGRVVYAARLRAGEWALVEEWVDATLLSPA